jgi:Spy/CpxP family protein refolding chaperone
MNRFIPAIAAACLSLAAAGSFAQAPAADAGKGPGSGGQGHAGHGGGHRHGLKPCSQEADPAKCEANRKEMRGRVKAAQDACKDKPDRRACMTEQVCAKAQDPAQCQARAKERQARHSQRADARQAIAEACTGKRGDELQQCYREQARKSGGPGAGRPAQGAERPAQK